MHHRNLYRISAIIEERALHRMLVALAELKAFNVETFAVTPDGPEPAAGPSEPHSVTPASLRKMATRNAILATMNGRASITPAELRAALPWLTPKAIAAAIFMLIHRDKAIRRIATGVYQLNGAPAAAAPAASSSSIGLSLLTQTGRIRSSKFVTAALEAAPHKTMTVRELEAALAAAMPGKSPKRTIESALGRLVRDKIVRKLGAGSYQLKG